MLYRWNEEKQNYEVANEFDHDGYLTEIITELEGLLYEALGMIEDPHPEEFEYIHDFEQRARDLLARIAEPGV